MELILFGIVLIILGWSYIPTGTVTCLFKGHQKEEEECFGRIYVSCSRCYKRFPGETRSLLHVESIWEKHHGQ